MVKPIKAKPLKTFTKFLEDEEPELDQVPLDESSWLSKGFAIGQGARHESTKRQLESLSNQVDALCDKAKREDELEDKIDILLDAISKFASGLKLQAELSKSNINVGIATNLLEDDIKTLLFRKK